MGLDANLAGLRQRLLAGTCRFDTYRFFTVRDSKERLISVAPFADRVLHHAVMDVCAPVFERAQVFDSYAYRAGKGTRAALERAAAFARSFPFYMKLDVHRYFDSIRHRRLKALLARLFEEPRLLSLLDAVVDGYAPFAKRPGAGLPIGNLTSQYFANHYLAGLDHYAKESVRVPAYVRYMDDIVVWGRSTGEVWRWGQALRARGEHDLELQLGPTCANRSAAGLPFLGFVVLPSGLRLSARSCRRARRRLRACDRALERGQIDQEAAAATARGVLARTDWSTGPALRRRLLNRSTGRCPGACTAWSAAAAGTTSPGTAAAPTATSVSVSCSPPSSGEWTDVLR